MLEGKRLRGWWIMRSLIVCALALGAVSVEHVLSVLGRTVFAVVVHQEAKTLAGRLGGQSVCCNQAQSDGGNGARADRAHQSTPVSQSIESIGGRAIARTPAHA